MKRRANLSDSFNLQRILDISTTSQYVCLSPNDIRDRIAAGTFPYINISKGKKPVFRFDVRQLDKWIDTRPGKKAEDLDDR